MLLEDQNQRKSKRNMNAETLNDSKNLMKRHPIAEKLYCFYQDYREDRKGYIDSLLSLSNRLKHNCMANITNENKIDLSVCHFYEVILRARSLPSELQSWTGLAILKNCTKMIDELLSISMTGLQKGHEIDLQIKQILDLNKCLESLEEGYFDFNTSYLLFHRKLAQNLCKLQDKKYQINEPVFLSQDLTSLLKAVYSLSQEQYEALMQHFDCGDHRKQNDLLKGAKLNNKQPKEYEQFSSQEEFDISQESYCLSYQSPTPKKKPQNVYQPMKVQQSPPRPQKKLKQLPNDGYPVCQPEAVRQKYSFSRASPSEQIVLGNKPKTKDNAISANSHSSPQNKKLGRPPSKNLYESVIPKQRQQALGESSDSELSSISEGFKDQQKRKLKKMALVNGKKSLYFMANEQKKKAKPNVFSL